MTFLEFMSKLQDLYEENDCEDLQVAICERGNYYPPELSVRDGYLLIETP